MDTSNIYRFNGKDPFDNWTIKDNVLYGYYPRNSLINALSRKGTNLHNENLIILDGIQAIGSSCFRNNRRYLTILIPESVKRIAKNAFLNCHAKLLVMDDSYALKYAVRHKLNYSKITKK